MESVVVFSGAFFLFLFGMDLANEGLQKLAAHKMRILLSWVTRNRVMALLLGGLATFTLQSSSITSVLLVNFVNSSLLRLDQALAMLLGANIGTTFTVQVLAMNITELAFILLIIGFLLKKGFQSEQIQNLGLGLIGFALLFYGMSLMSSAMAPLKDMAYVKLGLGWMKNSFLLSFLAAALLTALVHSSAVVIVLVMTLMRVEMIHFHDAIPMILGSNIGTCATALVASLGRGVNAWRLSIGNLSMKVIGVSLIIPVLPWFERFVVHGTHFLSPVETSYQMVANAHILFNLIVSILLLPGTVWAAFVLTRFIPAKKGVIGFNVESEGLEAVKHGISHMAQRIEYMLLTIMEVFQEGGFRKLSKVKDADEEIDLLNGYFLKYLTRKASSPLGSRESRQEMSLLYGMDVLEHVGDVISKDMSTLARKKMYKDLEFSIEDQGELEEFNKMIYNLFHKAVEAFLGQDIELAKEVLLLAQKAKEFKKTMYLDHLEAIQKGLREAMASTSIYFDVLTDLELIADYSAGLGKAVLE